jgi:hypothetical protein
MSRLIYILQIFLVYTVISISCALMLNIILGYSSFNDNVQFLVFKRDCVNIKIWRIAFYVHVFSAVIALFAGFTQFSKDFLNDYRGLHRLFGKIYVWNILIINFPAGLILALYANGGLLGKAAFLILDILWFFFTYNAFIFALEKNFVAHKYYMMRSFALTFSAITLRTWKIILNSNFDIEPNHLYIIESWIGFIPNLIIIEIIIWFYKKTDLSHK